VVAGTIRVAALSLMSPSSAPAKTDQQRAILGEICLGEQYGSLKRSITICQKQLG
jgi:hypothetical protein